MDVLDGQRTLKPDGIISIRIVEDKRDPVQQVIALTGEVRVPYIGLVKAAGFTCRELAYKIKAGLEKTGFEKSTVIVSYAGQRVMGCYEPPYYVVFGSVLKPGKYDLPVDQEMTISDVVKRAGGTTSKKKIPKIVVVRSTPQGKKLILVNTKAILIEKNSEYDLFLRLHDVVMVE